MPNPTWGLPMAGAPCLICRQGKERGGSREGSGRPNPPFPFSSLLSFPLVRPIWGAHQPLASGAFPLLAHKARIFCRGCPEPLPLTRYVPGTPRNTSDVQT